MTERMSHPEMVDVAALDVLAKEFIAIQRKDANEIRELGLDGMANAIDANTVGAERCIKAFIA